MTVRLDAAVKTVNHFIAPPLGTPVSVSKNTLNIEFIKHAHLDNGLDKVRFMVRGPSLFAEGIVYRIDPDLFRIIQPINDKSVERDMISRPVNSNDLPDGWTIREYIEKYDNARSVLMFNSTQGNFWSPNTCVIHHRKAVTKPSRGVFQKKYRPFYGTMTGICFDEGNRKACTITLRRDGIVIEPEIRNAVIGPLLLREGVSCYSEIAFDAKPALYSHQVNWSETRRMALSALGYDRQGLLVRVSLIGVSQDPTVEELISVLQTLDVQDAVLLGSSADIQTYDHYAGEFTVARANPGSMTGQLTPFGRPLGSLIGIVPRGQRRIQKLAFTDQPFIQEFGRDTGPLYFWEGSGGISVPVFRRKLGENQRIIPSIQAELNMRLMWNGYQGKAYLDGRADPDITDLLWTMDHHRKEMAATFGDDYIAVIPFGNMFWHPYYVLYANETLYHTAEEIERFKKGIRYPCFVGYHDGQVRFMEMETFDVNTFIKEGVSFVISGTCIINKGASVDCRDLHFEDIRHLFKLPIIKKNIAQYGYGKDITIGREILYSHKSARSQVFSGIPITIPLDDYDVTRDELSEALNNAGYTITTKKPSKPGEAFMRNKPHELVLNVLFSPYPQMIMALDHSGTPVFYAVGGKSGQEGLTVKAIQEHLCAEEIE
ncbi:MAG: hypothetical protein GF384_01980, partial [Elusimicrobia bacterium]|nr:hypothetical protein [Elusimicrobiota bacterium]